MAEAIVDQFGMDKLPGEPQAVTEHEKELIASLLPEQVSALVSGTADKLASGGGNPDDRWKFEIVLYDRLAVQFAQKRAYAQSMRDHFAFSGEHS